MIFPLVTPITPAWTTTQVTGAESRGVRVNDVTGVLTIEYGPSPQINPGDGRTITAQLTAPQLAAVQAIIKAAIAAAPGTPPIT